MTELKIWRQSKCSSIEEWIKSGMRMYKHTRTTEWNIIQPLKKKILPFVTTWMGLESIMLNAKKVPFAQVHTL